MFEAVVGHEPLKAYLRKAFAEGRLPHTLLFSGMDGIGKGLMARALAAALLGSSCSRVESGNLPDFHLGRPEGKSGLYAIDRIRTLIEKDHAPSFEGRGKVFVLEEADRMQPVSMSALLKTLEEPADDSTFILVSSAPKTMLPTILSRCVHLIFQPLPKEKIEEILKQRGLDPQFAKFSHGSVGRALELALSPKWEELKTILFQALEKRGNALETSKRTLDLEKRLDEEEDPVRQNQIVEHLFALVFMWVRDKEAVRHGQGTFFPVDSGQIPNLERAETALLKGRLAYQRNIKLSVIFDVLIAEIT